MKTVIIPVSKNAHHTQLPATPFCRTMSVTRLGVSTENVVATMEKPRRYQGIFLPERKYSAESLLALLVTQTPKIRVTMKERATMIQSIDGDHRRYGIPWPSAK